MHDAGHGSCALRVRAPWFAVRCVALARACVVPVRPQTRNLSDLDARVLRRHAAGPDALRGARGISGRGSASVNTSRQPPNSSPRASAARTNTIAGPAHQFRKHNHKLDRSQLKSHLAQACSKLLSSPPSQEANSLGHRMSNNTDEAIEEMAESLAAF